MNTQEISEDVTSFLAEIEADEAASTSITIDEDGIHIIPQDIPEVLSGKLYTATQYIGAKLVSVASGKISFGKRLGPQGKINYHNPLKIPNPKLPAGKKVLLQFSISTFGVSRYPNNSDRRVNTVKAGFAFSGDWKKGFILSPRVLVYDKNYATESMSGWAWIKATFCTYDQKIKGDF
jgi:hypothetical protein